MNQPRAGEKPLRFSFLGGELVDSFDRAEGVELVDAEY
jgi:hypothetical protein